MKCKIKNSKATRESIAFQGLTQVEVSKLTGISESYLSQILNGKRTCKSTTAKKIATVVNSDVKTQFKVLV